MFIDTIRSMLEDLEKHKRPKDSLTSLYVQARLTKSIQSYYSDLLKAQASLEASNTKKVFKELVQEDK